MRYTFPIKPTALTPSHKAMYLEQINALLKEKNAVIIAHYYTSPEIQALAESSGGFVGDSLEMAKFGHAHRASTLLISGVRFMGETAKILTPDKTVLMPNLDAQCSLDLGCPVDKFSDFCDQYPDHIVVVYANTSAAVKARADWVVTSSIALDVIEYLDEQGKKILWGPDRHLGAYIAKKTGAKMRLWDGECVVHDEFSASALRNMKHLYPNAAILVHPESPASVIELADAIGSTRQLIDAAKSLPQTQLIIATDKGIFYKMQQAVPDKELIAAPTAEAGASCQSCALCPWMALNALQGIDSALRNGGEAHQILLDENIRKRSLVSLNRMLDFTANM